MGKTALVIFRKSENSDPILFENVVAWSSPEHESRCFNLFIREKNGYESTAYIPSDAVLEILIGESNESQNSQS